MKVRKALTIVGAVLSLAYCGSTAMAATTIPYAQGFEGSFTVPNAAWTAGGSGIVSTHATAAKAGAGLQGLIVSNDTATLDIVNTSYTNVWIQVYAKPATGSADPAVTGVSGAFYVTGAGALRVYTAGAWQTVPGPALPTGQYLGFTIHANYTSGTWDIYQTSGMYKTNMTLLNTSGPLLFGTPGGTTLDKVIVESGDRADIDGVAVSRAFTTTGSAGSGDKVQAYEFHTNVLTEIVLPVYALAYSTPASAKTLAGRLGDDLRSAMVPLDSIYVFGTNGYGFERYTLVGGSWAVDPDTIYADPPANQKIYTATRIQTFLDPTHGVTFGFFPYSSTTVLAVAGKSTPMATSQGYSENFELNRKNAAAPGELNGYTALNWAKATTFTALPFVNGTHVQSGDRLFVSTPANPNAFTEYWRRVTPSAAWMSFSGVPQTGTIAAGSRMWLKRQNTSTQVTVTIPY